jgi:hypothetical protein
VHKAFTMMNDGNQIRRRTTATLTQPINGYSSAASSSNIGDGARGGGPVKQPQREQSILTTAALWLLGYIVIMAVMYKLGGSSNSVDIGSSGSSIGSIRMEMESWWSYVIQTKDLKSTPDEAMTRATKSSRNPLVRLLSGATFSPLVQRRKRQKPQDTPEQVANSATSRTSSTSSSSHLESADKDKVPKEKSIVAVEIEPTTPPLLPDKAVLPTTHYAFSEAYSDQPTTFRLTNS